MTKQAIVTKAKETHHLYMFSLTMNIPATSYFLKRDRDALLKRARNF